MFEQFPYFRSFNVEIICELVKLKWVIIWD
jgi:hypothetical protein